MELLGYFLPTIIRNWLRNQGSAEKEHAEKENKISSVINLVNLYCAKTENPVRGKILARHLYQDSDYRCPEIIRLLSEDLELAEETVKSYVQFFHFRSMTLMESLRSFLRRFWPDDEREIQHLLITHFSRRYIRWARLPSRINTDVYYLCWAIIMLNADLNGGHKGRKMTFKEFIKQVDRISYQIECLPENSKKIYKSIKIKPLEVFRVKSRRQAADQEERLIDENATTTVHKTGSLICKRVLDKNGRKTRKGRRAWKPFTAVLKGMVLYLQKVSSVSDHNTAIRLHHAMADPVDHRYRPHVLCLRTADSRLFYFQAESEVEQTSWVAIINLIAARYSAPPLSAASHDMKTPLPQVLPSYPSNLSLEQQLEHNKDRLRWFSGLLDDYLSLPFQDRALVVDYKDQMKRYTTYVRALQELIVEEDPGEGCSYSNSH